MTKIARTSAMKKALVAALVLGIAGPAFAGTVVLPEQAPIPMARPAAEQVQAPIVLPDREVIQISTAEQVIPEERRDVRIVGARFLPDTAADIDFAQVEQPAAVGYAEWFVMTTVSRMFETNEDTAEKTDGTLQVASNTLAN